MTAYVGDSLASAATGDLVLAFGYNDGTSNAPMLTPSGWQALLPAPSTAGNLQVWYVPSWSSGLSTTPSFGNTTALVFAVYSDAYLDSIAVGSSSNGVAPRTSTSGTTDVIVTAVGGAYVGSVTVPTITTPTGTTLRHQVNAAGAGFVGKFSLSFADTIGNAIPAGRSGSYTWTTGNADSVIYTPAVSVALIVGTAPTAPTIQSPTPGSYADFVADIWNFVATYNNIDGSSCGAYQFRMKVAGATTYSYWNASSGAMQSTAVWNPGTMDITFPSGVFVDGTTYNWSFNSQSSYSSTLTSGFAPDATVIGQANPTVTPTGPTGTIGSASATVTWTTTTASGASQTAFQVLTYLTSTTTASGFVPGQTAGLLDNSGVVTGAAGTYTTGQLPNEANLTSYLQVTESGNEQSSWESTSYATYYAAPSAPTLTAVSAVDGSGVPCIAVTVSGLAAGNTISVSYTDAENPTAVPARFGTGIVVTGTSYVVYDYEAIPLVARSYTAMQVTPADSADGYEILPSPLSAPATATLSVSSWWLIEPTAPDSSSQALNVTDNPVNRYAQVATHYPLGGPGVTYPVVVQAGISGQDGSVIVETTTQAEFAALEAAIELGTVKWLLSPYGWGVYCQIATSNPLSGMSGQAQQTSISPSPAANPIRLVTLQYTEQGRP